MERLYTCMWFGPYSLDQTNQGLMLWAMSHAIGVQCHLRLTTQPFQCSVFRWSSPNPSCLHLYLLLLFTILIVHHTPWSNTQYSAGIHCGLLNRIIYIFQSLIFPHSFFRNFWIISSLWNASYQKIIPEILMIANIFIRSSNLFSLFETGIDSVFLGLYSFEHFFANLNMLPNVRLCFYQSLFVCLFIYCHTQQYSRFLSL